VRRGARWATPARRRRAGGVPSRWPAGRRGRGAGAAGWAPASSGGVLARFLVRHVGDVYALSRSVCWHVCELPLKCHFRAHVLAACSPKQRRTRPPWGRSCGWHRRDGDCYVRSALARVGATPCATCSTCWSWTRPRTRTSRTPSSTFPSYTPATCISAKIWRIDPLRAYLEKSGGLLWRIGSGGLDPRGRCDAQ